MPLALHFAFNKKMGVMGLWFGMAIACVILDIGFYVIIKIGFKQKETTPVPQSPSLSGRKLAVTQKKEAEERRKNEEKI